MHTNSNTTSDVIFHLWVSGLHSGNMEDVKSITLNSSTFFKYGSLEHFVTRLFMSKVPKFKELVSSFNSGTVTMQQKGSGLG